MSDTRVVVEWDSPLDMDYNTGLGTLSFAIKAATGGVVNNIDRRKDGSYFAVVYIPLMASKLLHFDKEEFLYLLFAPYHLNTYKITNVEVGRNE